ncbi:MAG: Imidazole glycerol phosphate synthase subunit HisH [Myxococcota bacterium]|nr:Imidazole glycerol phosphate synthase subunit HisH [Myxococcota bacterium]
MLLVIDYGRGNLRSVEQALRRLGAPPRISSDPADVAMAGRVILPGVGAFGDCMDALRARGLIEPILDHIAAGKPYLGICLGMQILFNESEEYGQHKGLGVLPGRVIRFRLPGGGPLKIPHMGWNGVHHAGGEEARRLWEGIPDNEAFYFVHSYHVMAGRDGDVAGLTNHGGEFCAAAARNHVYGVQFHPEKSQNAGLRLLQNFIRNG